jgi:hypothetical protein
LSEQCFLDFCSKKVRKGIENEELKIGKWTRFVRIMEIKLGNDFGSMTKLICQNP